MAICLALGVAACGSDGGSSGGDNFDIDLLTIGDGLTNPDDSFGPRGNGWPEMIKDIVFDADRIVNVALLGTTSEDWKGSPEPLFDAVFVANARYCVVLLGTNDALLLRDPVTDFDLDIGRVLGASQVGTRNTGGIGCGEVIVVVPPQQYQGDVAVDAVNAQLGDLLNFRCSSNTVDVITCGPNLFDIMVEADFIPFVPLGDGIFPTADGKIVMINAILPFLGEDPLDAAETVLALSKASG